MIHNSLALDCNIIKNMVKIISIILFNLLLNNIPVCYISVCYLFAIYYHNGKKFYCDFKNNLFMLLKPLHINFIFKYFYKFLYLL